MTSTTLARLALGGLALAEAALATQRWCARRRGYDAAAARARALGRPLIVVGDPDAGAHTRLQRAYGCGDLCVDLHGCAKCPVVLAADLTQGPIAELAEDSAVVFVSCVLEYVEDLPAARRELLRIAGSPDNIFLITVQPFSLTSRLYPGARWTGPADDGGAAMVPVTMTQKILAGGALVVLGVASL